MAFSTGAWLALASAGVAGAFAVMVAAQFVRRRKAYQLAWSVGLGLFTLASALEFVSELRGWDVVLYRSYFALHPTLVAVLGLGTVYLLADRRWARAFLVYIVVVTAILLAFTATAEVDTETFVPGRVVGAAAMPDAVRGLSLLFTIPGAAALIGGAVYSWWRTRWGYNLLIAAGAALMSTGGTLTRLGQAELLYVFLLVGIAVMFAGFLQSRAVPRRTPAAGSATAGE